MEIKDIIERVSSFKFFDVVSSRNKSETTIIDDKFFGDVADIFGCNIAINPVLKNFEYKLSNGSSEFTNDISSSFDVDMLSSPNDMLMDLKQGLASTLEFNMLYNIIKTIIVRNKPVVYTEDFSIDLLTKCNKNKVVAIGYDYFNSIENVKEAMKNLPGIGIIDSIYVCCIHDEGYGNFVVYIPDDIKVTMTKLRMQLMPAESLSCYPYIKISTTMDISCDAAKIAIYNKL